MISDIEFAVKQGRALQASKGDEDDESADLEVGLREVAETASSFGGRAGLLGSVKNFNALLERALAAS